MIRISTLACILLASLVLVSAQSAVESTNAAETTKGLETTMAETTKGPETTIAEATTKNEMTTAEKTTQKAETTAAESTTKKEETTTAAPTTAAPTTAATTTAAPSASAGTFVVMQNNTACVVMTAQVFSLTIKCEKDNMERTFEINSNYTTVSGLCEQSYDLMTLTDDQGRFVVSLNFTEIGSNYHIGNIDVKYPKEANCEYMSSDITTDLRSPKANIYRCNALQKIVVNDNSTIALQGVRLQAFRNKGNSTSLDGTEYICMEDSTVSNVVPIAVGCALAGLIIIVLIAYIIGRLRRRPYEPV